MVKWAKSHLQSAQKQAKHLDSERRKARGYSYSGEESVEHDDPKKRLLKWYDSRAKDRFDVAVTATNTNDNKKDDKKDEKKKKVNESQRLFSPPKLGFDIRSTSARKAKTTLKSKFGVPAKDLKGTKQKNVPDRKDKEPNND